MKLLDLIIQYAREYDNDCCKESSGILGMPRFFYDLFISKPKKRKRVIGWASTSELREALLYIQDKKLKTEVYEELRQKVFEGRTSSSIIKEIGGLLNFAGRIIKYIKITTEMRRELK